MVSRHYFLIMSLHVRAITSVSSRANSHTIDCHSGTPVSPCPCIGHGARKCDGTVVVEHRWSRQGPLRARERTVRNTRTNIERDPAERSGSANGEQAALLSQGRSMMILCLGKDRWTGCLIRPQERGRREPALTRPPLKRDTLPFTRAPWKPSRHRLQHSALQYLTSS